MLRAGTAGDNPLVIAGLSEDNVGRLKAGKGIMTTHQLLAEHLHARVGSPIRGAGPCLEVLRGLDDLLTRFIAQVIANQRQGRLLANQAPEAIVRVLLVEVITPGAGREPPECDVVI